MLQQQPRPRTSASHLSLTALACTVVLAGVLPIAVATAGPAAGPDEASGPAAAAHAPAASPPDGPVLGGRTGHHVRTVGPGRAEAAAGKSMSRAPASCGPELTTPERLSAQTCVLSEGGRTWARTYYRNSTGSPLSAALTLTRPDGSALSARCAVPSGGRPGVCETPRELSRAGGRPYAATAEAGTADGDRLLLRSASNPVAG
ncbi:hypothetical protein [Streptomyces sp. WMMB 322]|uniref:hypothetical protein n=1 Tax=Streptomyces sp. WMMB 322 TaxID=1286821 RepID=UPI0006E1E685|nr:hypothetical protein [Streptomyces sp. WMMB 322]SCK13960.1 hypothetical protein H180DRAFT_00871 [Streptomyces sp. WMMB 322]